MALVGKTCDKNLSPRHFCTLYAEIPVWPLILPADDAEVLSAYGKPPFLVLSLVERYDVALFSFTHALHRRHAFHSEMEDPPPILDFLKRRGA